MTRMSARRLYPPLSALRAAEAAARLGGFTAAASELNISQSAVSQSVRQLETQLGIALFERRTGGIALTEPGRRYINAIGPALLAIEEAGEAIIGPARRRLTIGAVRSLLHNWLLPRLPLFGVRRPELDLNVIGLGRDIAEARTCDLALTLQDIDQPPAGGTLIAREILVAVSAPIVADDLGVPLEWFAGEVPVALLGSGWDAWTRAAGQEKNVAHKGLQFRDASAALEAAREGQGIALAGSLTCHDDLLKGLLVRVSDIRLERGRGYWLVGRDCNSPVGAAFRSWLQEMVEETEKS